MKINKYSKSIGMNISPTLLIAIIIFCFQSEVDAQTTTTTPYGALSNTQSVRDELGIAAKNGIQNAYAFGSRYEGVRGLPFYKNSWSEGVVCLKRDSAVVSKPDLRLRFDSYANELWIKQGKDSLIAYSRDINWFVLIDGDIQETFLKVPGINKAFPNYFYRLLFKGQDYLVYKEVKNELVRADLVDKGMVSTGLPYDRFEEKAKYYLQTKDGVYHKFKPTVKGFMAELPKRYHKKLKTYCKASDISGKLSDKEITDMMMFLQGQP